MLYDPKWEVKTKTDPLSLESLIAWLEKMPANKKYPYRDCSGLCLYGLYMASHGIGWMASGACGATNSTPERFSFCCKVYEEIASQQPWTFGAALERAQASSKD